jgi:hypothetical protein
MGLTVGQRRAVTTAIATRYKRADKAAKGCDPWGLPVDHDRSGSISIAPLGHSAAHNPQPLQ